MKFLIQDFLIVDSITFAEEIPDEKTFSAYFVKCAFFKWSLIPLFLSYSRFLKTWTEMIIQVKSGRLFVIGIYIYFIYIYIYILYEYIKVFLNLFFCYLIFHKYTLIHIFIYIYIYINSSQDRQG